MCGSIWCSIDLLVKTDSGTSTDSVLDLIAAVAVVGVIVDDDDDDDDAVIVDTATAVVDDVDAVVDAATSVTAVGCGIIDDKVADAGSDPSPTNFTDADVLSVKATLSSDTAIVAFLK